MLMGENTGNWPNEYKQLEQYGLVAGLERLSGEIKKAKGQRAIEMVKLREGMFQAINDCAGMLEATAHKTSLKGGCEYL